jgi:hypothetical protein
VVIDNENPRHGRQTPVVLERSYRLVLTKNRKSFERA